MITDKELLRRVKSLVTKKQTPNMQEATGIPPHVTMMQIMKSAYDHIEELYSNIDKFCATIT